MPPVLCPKCGTTAGGNEGFCRQCGASLRGATFQGPTVGSLPGGLHVPISIAALIIAVFSLLSGDQLFHLCGVAILLVVGWSAAFRFRRRPEYRVFKQRRRAKGLKNARLVVSAAPDEGTGYRGFRVEGKVVLVVAEHHDEIVVRVDEPLSTNLGESDLVALVPLESGRSFAALLDEGLMRVQMLLVNRAYLALGRGNLLARRTVRRNPPINIGTGLAVLEGTTVRKVY